jgi:fibronectin type 3 domain-containing protein
MPAEIRNRYEEIVEKARQEGRVRIVSQEESSEMYDSIDSEMETFRRDFEKKANESQIEASKIVLTS